MTALSDKVADAAAKLLIAKEVIAGEANVPPLSLDQALQDLRNNFGGGSLTQVNRAVLEALVIMSAKLAPLTNVSEIVESLNVAEAKLDLADAVIAGQDIDPPIDLEEALAAAADQVAEKSLEKVGATDGSNRVGFQQAGLGAVPRTVEDELRERVSVKQFGAKGDGTTDDTAEIQAAIAYLTQFPEKSLYFPRGVYLVSAPLVITGSKWTIYGDGEDSSIIKTTLNGDIFQIDLTAGSSNRGTIRDLGFDRVFTMPYSDSCAIHVVTISGVSGGLYKWKFKNLQYQHLYRLIRFGATAKEMWQGVASIEKHSFCEFENLSVLASSAYQPFECISFDEGCGPHHTIMGGNLFASGAGSACIKIGNGGTNTGFGDLLIVGVHMTDAESGVKMVGPTGANIYNQNVTITGCQFDGAGMLYTINATRMKNCRFGPNNSTTSGAVTLTDCDNIAFQDQSNNLYAPTLSAGSLTKHSNGVTFGAKAQLSSLIGYVQDLFNWSADTLGSIIMIGKSRGTKPGVHAAVQSGDRVGEIRYVGSDGAGFKPGAMIAVNAAATPTTGDACIPMTVGIRTSPNASTSPVDRIFADEAGNVVLAGDKISSTPTSGTNGFVYMQKMMGAPTGIPAKSYNGHVPMIVDETNSKIWVYIGSTWKSVTLT